MDLPASCHGIYTRCFLPTSLSIHPLGSGETFVLDINIVFQSFIYDPRRVMCSKVRRKSLGSVSGEEQRLLLSTDHRIEEAC